MSRPTESQPARYRLTQLQTLESESISIFREVVAEVERPVLLFSGGKDSAVMLRLAEKAFWPARIPFPVMPVDTGHNFAEVLKFRWPSNTPPARVRALVKELQYRLNVNTLHREPDVDSLRLNDSGRVRLRTTLPLYCDTYRRNRTTGSFVLIDETTNRTVGAEMIN
jgi:3'-phosphoadenosine 5'-phosphosulfate sulfotransferase (PAPS reductase)/FAD synthetase